ncbi:MAG: type II toxin-antitoxin system Phd/YefM family antitoxin [Gammaproteobacteria bacterium]
MQQINIHEAKTHLSRLLERVEAGEEVVISRNGKPIVRLVKYEPARKPRKPGSLKGKIWMADDFDETSEDIIDAFYNGPIFPDEL